MEAPAAYAAQLTDSAAAWSALGLLIGVGRPAHPSELSRFFASDSIRFLCSIPSSPLRLTDNGFVTLSQTAVDALAHFFANSDLIARYLDLPHFVPRFFANVRSNGAVRTYCRKRKRSAEELVDFLTTNNRRFCLDLVDGKNSNQMAMTVPYTFQNVTSQGIETLSSLPSLTAFENAEHVTAEIPSMQRISCLHRMNAKSNSLHLVRTPYTHRIMAEEILASVPSPKPSHPFSSKLEEGGGIGNPLNYITISAPSELEIQQMIVAQEKSGAVTQECDSFTEGFDGKTKELIIPDSDSCKAHSEYHPVGRIHKIKYGKDNHEKALPKSNNMCHTFIRPRTEGHHQCQRDTLIHSIEHSSGINPDNKHEMYDRKKTVSPTKDNCRGLSDIGREQCKIDKNAISIRQAEEIECDQVVNTKEERGTSIENRERLSSISNNIEQAPFPEFESFIVEKEEGSGGYGTVYRARRKADGEIFAIKCPHVNANKTYVKNEMEMLERLGGKAFVIKYEGSFKSGSADCLVLQHVQHDRPEFLKRELDIGSLQWYAYCLFKALAGLHRQGIVHRDVKPGNFLYSCKLRKGFLIDFNLALDMRKKYGAVDNCRVRQNFNDPTSICQTNSLSPAKSRRLIHAKCTDAVTKNAGKVCITLLPPGNLKRKADKAKGITEAGSRNISKSQGADGSGITSAKDATSTRTVDAKRLREPLICRSSRKELSNLAQEAMQGGNHESIDVPKSKRKRVAAPAGDSGSKILHVTPMPLHANGIAIRGAGSLRSKGDRKPAREGPCPGTKGFKAPEVLFRSLHQGPKADIWSAGVTLLYLMIGKTPFAGDTEQNIKEIAKLRGSEDLWEVAKLHNHESLFPVDLLDVKYRLPVNLRDWCARNTRRPEFLDAIPRSLFDLVDKCLMVNPRQRMSADEALKHDFFAECNKAFRKQRLLREGLTTTTSSVLLHGEPNSQGSKQLLT